MRDSMKLEATLFDDIKPTNPPCRTCERLLRARQFRAAASNKRGHDTECTECRQVREIAKIDGTVWPLRPFNNQSPGCTEINSPSGILHGTLPIGNYRQGERNIAAGLARAVGGLVEVQIRGRRQRADVGTDTTIWEVKQAAKWAQGWRQLRDYAEATGLKPALALYGKGSRMNALEYLYPLIGEPLATVWLLYADDRSRPHQPYGWVEIGNWRDTKHKRH